MAQNPLSPLRARLYFWLAILLLALAQVLALSIFTPLSREMLAVDALLAWLLLGGLIFGLLNTLAYYFPTRAKALLVLAPLGLTAIWFFLSRFMALKFASLITPQPEVFTLWFEQNRFFRLTVAFLFFAGATGFSAMWYLLQEKESLRQRQGESEKLLREAELYKLRQQVQPHFLFNSLNSVIALIGSKPTEARKMLQNLSGFFRASVSIGDEKQVSLARELEHLELYLNIEQVRFGHRLKVIRQIQSEAREVKIPPLLLQPLLENAVKHGLYGTTASLEISLSARLENDLLKVQLSNPYEPGNQPQKGTGFGLQAVNRRLYLLYGRTDLLQAQRENSQFMVTLILPQKHVPSTDN